MIADKKKILLVEDDVKLCKLVKEFLEGHHFDVDLEHDGAKAVDRILLESPDLIILDIMLPGMDGITICEKVRSQSNDPILMLTALGEENDELTGLEAGADDYLVKPVKPKQLLARIKALLRRVKWVAEESQSIKLKNMVIDAGRHAVEINKKWLDLTTAEFDLLWLLANYAGKVVTRDKICAVLRGFDYNGLDRSIDLRIARLRKKLGDKGKNPNLIKSIRSMGYMLVD